MSTTTISEADLATLRADAGRVQTLESERDAANQRATAAENRTAAVELLTESGHTFNRLERAGLLAALPVVKETGALDVETFNKAIKEAADERGDDTEAGGITGFGSTTTVETTRESTDPWASIDATLGIKEA